MPSYFAFLGHQPHISIAELAAVVPDFNQIDVIDKQFLIFESSADLDALFLSQLGGTILLARRLTDSAVSIEDVPQMLLKEVEGTRGKITYSIRAIGVPKQKVQSLFRQSKQKLKQAGKPSRYVGNERKPAAPVLLHDAGMLDGKHGCEIVIIQKGNDIWVGKTFAAQDVDSYAKRDMQKPVRDTGVGLLPPKLAQVLLNFGAWAAGQPLKLEEPKTRGRKPKVTEFFTVLDPFCGTGVIPMECLLRGWAVVASDVSQKAVNGTTKNMDWIRKEEGILKKDLPSTILKHDATKSFSIKESPNVIVTETSLGTNFEKRPNAREASKQKNENEKLQADFLKVVAENFPGVPVVCTWPVWVHGKGKVELEKIWDAAEKIGYTPVLPEGIAPAGSRTSLLYKRPGQYVAREIVILKPSKTTPEKEEAPKKKKK